MLDAALIALENLFSCPCVLGFIPVRCQQSDPAEMGAYEELLYDAMRGNSGRFARQDYVGEAWRIVNPILKNAVPVYEYEPGSWGPQQASALIAPDGGWFDPTPPR